MGETRQYQPLTKSDRISVVIYRLGIACSAITVFAGALLALCRLPAEPAGLAAAATVLALYVSVGASVIFIHLYMSAYKRNLHIGYATALACLIALYMVSGGNLPAAFSSRPYVALLLIPLAGCLGFITAKEAFCFRLLEGYVLAVLMPAYLAVVATGLLGTSFAAYGLAVIAVLLIVFTMRKVFMPLHYDIGDKTAYA